MSEETNDAPTGEDVSLEQAEAAARQAGADADDREETAIAWAEVIETPALALNEETFRGQLGKAFEIELGQNDLAVTLEDVASLGRPADTLGEGAPGARSAFSLIFRGSEARAVLPEGFYRVRNEALGELEMCLQPVEAEDAEEGKWIPQFEAVFN